jgi:hypothetical protein
MFYQSDSTKGMSQASIKVLVLPELTRLVYIPHSGPFSG